MEWVSDYIGFCLDHGFGGLVLLALSAGAAVIAALAVVVATLRAVTVCAQAFAKGWREAG